MEKRKPDNGDAEHSPIPERGMHRGISKVDRFRVAVSYRMFVPLAKSGNNRGERTAIGAWHN
jgi:hypothetical protein